MVSMAILRAALRPWPRLAGDTHEGQRRRTRRSFAEDVLHQREVPRVVSADQSGLCRSSRGALRGAPRRSVDGRRRGASDGSAFRQLSSIPRRRPCRPALPMRRRRRGCPSTEPVTGTRGRSESARRRRARHSHALEVAVRAINVVESQHRRVQEAAPFQCGQGLRARGKALF